MRNVTRLQAPHFGALEMERGPGLTKLRGGRQKSWKPFSCCGRTKKKKKVQEVNRPLSGISGRKELGGSSPPGMSLGCGSKNSAMSGPQS